MNLNRIIGYIGWLPVLVATIAVFIHILRMLLTRDDMAYGIYYPQRGFLIHTWAAYGTIAMPVLAI